MEDLKKFIDDFTYNITVKDESMLKVISDILKSKKIKDNEKLSKISEKIDFYWKKREQMTVQYLRDMRKGKYS